MTISDTLSNVYYSSNKELCKDLALALNVEIKRLVKAGCKYIQVDEPLFATAPRDFSKIVVKPPFLLPGEGLLSKLLPFKEV